MKINYQVLIVDDRPMMLNGMKHSLYNCQPNQIQVDVCFNYREALILIKDKEKQLVCYDFIIADIDVNQIDNEQFKSNEDYLNDIRNNHKHLKLITIIRRKEHFRIYGIIKSIRPEAFVLENELKLGSLIEIIKKIEKSEFFYSESVRSIAHNEQFIYFDLDDIDREILFLLKNGIKTKLLPNYIPRSLSTIEKRKQRIKDLLVMKNCTDDKLLEEAILRNLI